MKKQLLFAVSLVGLTSANAQSFTLLDGNNVSARVNNNGIFFTNTANYHAAYEVPAGSGNNPLYGTAFWMAGVNMGNGNIHTACNLYGSGYDFFPGPVADDYNSTDYLNNYAIGMWKMTRDQINYHVANYTTVGYVPDPAITAWPGNGNTANGMAEQLAPYVDVNNDGVYDPMDGDFPYIQGDQAVYVILNDVAGLHTQTNSAALGAEIHAMFYQFETADAINNTTFLNVKIHNRSSMSFDNFQFALYMDTDIGYPMDDYVGSDSARSLAYAYNGSAMDPGGNGQPGYGTNPPAFGAKLLNDQAHAAMYFSNSGGITGNPNTASDFYYLMHAKWLNGAPLTYGSTIRQFLFSGNPATGTGWTETNDGNAPGDRRILLSTKDTTFTPGTVLCYDFAFVFDNSSNNHLQNVQSLLTTADEVQDFYDHNIQPCNQIFLGSSIKLPELNIAVYPNPSNGTFTIDSPEPVILSVFDISGKAVKTNVQVNPSEVVNMDLENGIYLFELRTATGVAYERVQISH